MSSDIDELLQKLKFECDEVDEQIERNPTQRLSILQAFAKKASDDREAAMRMFTYEIFQRRRSMESTPRSITINVSGAVGNFNLGKQLGNISANATILRGNSQEGLADALQKLSEGIGQSPNLPEKEKQEAIESLSEISDHASNKGSKLSAGVRAMLTNLPILLAAAADCTELWTNYSPAILKFFGL